MSSPRCSSPLVLDAAVPHGFNFDGRSFLTIPHSVTFELRGVVQCLQASNTVPPHPVRASILACALKIFLLVTPTDPPIPDEVTELHHSVAFNNPQKTTRRLVEVVAVLRALVDRGGGSGHWSQSGEARHSVSRSDVSGPRRGHPTSLTYPLRRHDRRYYRSTRHG